MQRKRTADRQQWLYRVYTYKATLHDLSPPQKWPEALRQVVFAQRDLWNACHAAWDVNRTQYEALMQQGEVLAPLREARETAQQAVDAVQARITARRQQTRKRLYPDWQTDAEALDAARQALRQTRDTLHHAEAAYRVHIRPQLSTLLETLWQTVHALGQAAPLPWYNERQVTDSFRHCVERFLKHQGGPPKPKRFLDRVHLTYHFTGPPLTWEQLLLGKSSMIVFGDERGKLPERRTHGHLRITDTDTLEFGVTLHRRPPEGTLVKGVELVGRERTRGWREHLPLWSWTFYVLCELPPREWRVESGEVEESSEVESGEVESGGSGIPLSTHHSPLATTQAALDLNWRILDDDRIRVGMVYDGTTYTPLYFPAFLVERWRACQQVQQDIAAHLTRCKTDLETIWAQTPLPPDLDPRGVGWAQTGQRGLLALLRAVEAVPVALPSRQPTLAVLEPWAVHAGHLWRHWSVQSARIVRAKAHWYSTVAKGLCTQYRQLALEALDLKRMAEARDQAHRLQQSQKYRQLVGLGALLQRLAHTAQREGVMLVKVAPEYTSRTCPQCGTVLSNDQWEPQAGEQFVQCPQGHRWDVDVGAAKIIFDRAFSLA